MVSVWMEMEKMKLQDLISVIPKDKIGIQYLNECVVSAKEKGRKDKHTEITFATDAVNVSQAISGAGKFCYLVWIDRGELEKALENHRSQSK